MTEWRLVHNGKKIVMFSECNDESRTTTKHTLFAGTKGECLAEIKRLGLEYDDEEIN